ncbi:carotenoid oxygenase family protein [Spirulina major]|uniref:carotenoid oxygenase family protein n=1 Tax=Spirulina major TaxID=270636 RepID=UPI00093544E6|nr:carotenoid oxygenase family protein [Spirulina major]
MQTLDSSATTTPYFDRKDWQRGYESQRQEISTVVDRITGTIPPELTGTLFRNGPGLLDINGEPIHHPFDGDGMVCAIAFRDGHAYFQNRFVRTEGFVKEQAAKKSLYRGVFGTKRSGGWLANLFNLNVKNIANTNVIYWGDRLLALWEGGKPHRLNPHTLETLGLDDLDGILDKGGSFSAHPRIDPASILDDGQPCLVNFSISPGPVTTLNLYELSPDGKLLRKQSHPVPGFAFIHDFAITPHYALFFQNPVQFNPLPFLLGQRGAAECIKFQPDQDTKVIIVPRDPNSNRTVQTLNVRAGFIFHHANAWEEDENTIGIDSICYADFPEVEPDSDFREIDFTKIDPGQLWRFRFDLHTRAATAHLIESRCVEFPAIHPHQEGRSYRYTYLAAAAPPTGHAPHQALLKHDFATGTQQFYCFGPRQFVTEPVFVPKPGETDEDAGWVLTMVYDADRHGSDLAIFNAQDLEAGAIATLHLDLHIPFGLHGNWTDQIFWPNEAA